jgi:cysteine desulfurase / selenocysteine lyase
MSTSDIYGLVLPAEADPLSIEVPAGLPDPAVLARMANEFFSALPDGGNNTVREVPSQIPTISAVNVPVTAPALRPEISLTSDPHFQSAPASAGPTSVSPVSAPAQATLPSVPSGIFGAPSELPVFGFFEEARPIFGDKNTVPELSHVPARPLADFMSAGVFTTSPPLAFDDDTLKEAASILQPPSPTLASPFGIADSSAVPAFSFLEEARPLFSYQPAIPGPVPAPPQTTPLVGDAPVSFAFLSDVRSISAVDPGQDLKPIHTEADVPRALNLSSYSFDAQALKRDFPILCEKINGRPLVWLDNAATTQKPQSVIDRLKYFYEHENSNVHRAAHELAARATDAYESAREKVRRFLNASSSREIIFVRGATEGINLVAQSWGRRNIQKDDEIVITWLEHHANIVPWQMLCAEKGARLRVAPVDDSGQVLLDEYEKLLGPKTRLVALPQVSNALGIVPPATEMIEAAHRHGAKVLLDGAQSVSHMRVDVQSLDCDFFVFSGHKVFAPTGIGVVYGKSDVLEHMPPWQGGGNMIQDVTFEKTLYQPPPQRFEAGTGNIADAVGLGAAIDYLDRAGMPNISRHEHTLLTYATEELERIPGLRIIGKAKEKAGVLSFVLNGFRTEEIGHYLNRYGIAVRSGHHCAQPILRRFGLESTVRASLALYNTFEDIDTLVAALWDLVHGHNSIQ